MHAPRVCMGIDPSLTSTGVSVRVNGKVLAFCITGGEARGMQRVVKIRDSLEHALDRYTPTMVAFEGLAMGFSPKTSNNVLNLAELAGVLKLLILARGIGIVLVPPTSLKLFATGKGNAKKDQVSLGIQAMAGVSFSTDDQYDAAGLLLMAEMFRRETAALRGRGGYLPHRVRALESVAFIPGF